MRLQVEPHLGVGLARLGMGRDELRAAMRAVPESFRKGQGALWETDAFFESGFQVFYGGREPRVEYIELSRDAGLEPFVDGIDVFATPAAELVERLDQKCRFDRDHSELGYSYVFREWDLALWRPVVPEGPTDEGGRYFSTIGVGVRGYFDANAG